MKDENIDRMKTDLFKEVKSICNEVQKIQTFSGLVSLEPRIYEMCRHLTVLKYLDEKTTTEDFRLAKDTVTKEPHVEKTFPNRKENQKNIENYQALQLNFNDKIAFENQLFNKDSRVFSQFLEKVNQSESLGEALEILQAYYQKFHWEEKEEFAKRLEKLVEKRFE